MKAYILLTISLFSVNIQSQCFQAFSSTASHSITLKTDGTLWAWGSNNRDEVGICNGSGHVFSPIQISNLPVWSKIFAVADRTFVIKNDGTLWACGSGAWGSLGTGEQNDLCTLTQIGTDSDWNEVYSGQGTIAKKNNGTLWGWGANIYGQLNLGTNSLEFAPIQISTETNWNKINMAYHTLALKTNGTIWACGLNDKGQIGDGTTTDRLNFVQVGTATNWADIASGYLDKNSFAIKNDGTFWGWGLIDGLGLFLQPQQIGSENNWSKVSGIYKGAILIKQNGTLWLYGQNSFQQIGTDTNWVTIYGGFAHFFAMKSDGTLWGYGNNSQGQLGLGSSIDYTSVLTQLNCSEFLDVEEQNPLGYITLYPNPTSDVIFIKNNSNITIQKITVTDITGKMLLETTTNFSEIDMQHFGNGVYIVNISSEGKIYNYKIVKK